MNKEILFEIKKRMRVGVYKEIRKKMRIEFKKGIKKKKKFYWRLRRRWVL